MKMKKGDIIEVTWLDAWSNSNGRFDDHYAYGPLTMLDVGYFVHENDDAIVLCHTNQSDGVAWIGETTIPWEMVISIEILS